MVPLPPLAPFTMAPCGLGMSGSMSAARPHLVGNDMADGAGRPLFAILVLVVFVVSGLFGFGCVEVGLGTVEHLVERVVAFLMPFVRRSLQCCLPFVSL